MHTETACSIVIATWNRRARVGATLDVLVASYAGPIIVVDNGSNDGTVPYLQDRFPSVLVIALERNIGAAARNVGVRTATTPYVAFCDDDTQWQPGSIARGIERLDRHGEVALINARIVVGSGRIDESCVLMELSPVPKRCDYPGPSIVRFMACAAIVRRAAFLDVGGYHARYFLGAEETLVAADLIDRRWDLVYDCDLTVHHDAENAGRDHRERRIIVARNRLWTAWLRFSWPNVARYTGAAIWAALRAAEPREALSRAVRGIAWISRERRVMRSAAERRFLLATELPP